jgi:drug/metabolite transporter (DMT)-like permease
MNGKNRWHYLATIGAMLIWSSSFIATKVAYRTFPPITLAAARFLVALILLGVARLVMKEHVKPTRKELVSIAFSGFMGITLYFLFENIGLMMTTASSAALIVASFPAITLVGERIVYKTPITGRQVVGIVLAVVGVYLISVSAQKAEGAENPLLGNLILLGTGVVWAAYIFSTRKVVGRLPAITLSFYQTLAGFIGFLPFTLFEIGKWQAPTGATFSMLLYLGALCSVAAYLMYNFGLRQLKPSTSAFLMNLVPIFGTLFSVVLLGEKLTLRHLAGGVLVILGVIVSVRVSQNGVNKAA